MKYLSVCRKLAWLSCLPVLAIGMLSSCTGEQVASNAGPEINEATLPPHELVFRYVGLGEASKLDALLKSNPELANIAEDTYYNTPLHVAALNGNQKIVDVLLANGADPMIENANGEIPAETALQEAHVELSKYLMGVQAAAPAQ